ncbi:MAG TPA: ABC transporter ATP-binding protein [Micropepsaceae bacterium]|nr:ABC transporter ATP-binding protein [Micropepsaceae bacterium]
MSKAAPGGEVLGLINVARSFGADENRLDVFSGVNLSIRAGELVALLGPSGSGKSSLLHIAGLLEAPSAGIVRIEGETVEALSDVERTCVRRRALGFVYQFHHLLPEFSALENVAIPQMITGAPKAEAQARARQLLERVGLGERLTHRPAKLSGGEQQRVAIARALANRPKLLLADEPTGNLDPRTADKVFALLLEIVRGDGLAALIATHNHALAAAADRTLVLDNGQLVERG